MAAHGLALDIARTDDKPATLTEDRISVQLESPVPVSGFEHNSLSIYPLLSTPFAVCISLCSRVWVVVAFHLINQLGWLVDESKSITVYCLSVCSRWSSSCQMDPFLRKRCVVKYIKYLV